MGSVETGPIFEERVAISEVEEKESGEYTMLSEYGSCD